MYCIVAFNHLQISNCEIRNTNQKHPLTRKLAYVPQCNAYILKRYQNSESHRSLCNIQFVPQLHLSILNDSLSRRSFRNV